LLALGLLASANVLPMAFASTEDQFTIPPELPWTNKPFYGAYDVKALRRGYKVYRQVCAACHGLRFVHYRHLVGTVLTQEEAKAVATEAMVWDGPNEKGKMFQRPATLLDAHPNPYQNEQEARAANNGSYPPDQSLIVKAREFGADYVFYLLVGYRPPPHGMQLRDGQFYNPYFPGGVIGMRPPIYDNQIEYDDGTPATMSQMAKDVTEFLWWTAEPEADVRKSMGIQILALTSICLVATIYLKRLKWSVITTRKFQFKEF